jgi:glucose dehydrogenase
VPVVAAPAVRLGARIRRRARAIPADNPAPDFMPRLRDGANLYANTLLALDARTGRLRDHVQVLDGRRDWHDCDVSATPALVRTRRTGAPGARGQGPAYSN